MKFVCVKGTKQFALSNNRGKGRQTVNMNYVPDN